MPSLDQGFGARGFTVEEAPSSRKLAPEVKPAVTNPLPHFHEPNKNEEDKAFDEQVPTIKEDKSKSKKIFKPISLKINSIEDADEEEQDEFSINTGNLPTEPITQSVFDEAWAKLSNAFQNERLSLFAALSTYDPVIDNENNILLQVDNAIQENLVFERKPDLLAFLRRELNNHSVTLNTKVVADQARAIHPDPKRKLELLIEKNQQVKNLCDQFGLDLLF